MLQTTFTKLTGCTVPVQLAPMPDIATPALAAAVADAGGLGMIGTAMVPPPALETMLQELRRRTRGVFGAGFLMPFLDRDCEAAEKLREETIGEIAFAGMKMPVPRLSVISPTTETTGAIEAMALYAGESVTNVTRVQPAAEILREISKGAERLLRASVP